MRTDALQRDGCHHIIYLGWGKLSNASAIIKQEYGGGKVDFLVVNNPSKMVILHLCLKIMGGDMT